MPRPESLNPEKACRAVRLRGYLYRALRWSTCDGVSAVRRGLLWGHLLLLQPGGFVRSLIHRTWPLEAPSSSVAPLNSAALSDASTVRAASEPIAAAHGLAVREFIVGGSRPTSVRIEFLRLRGEPASIRHRNQDCLRRREFETLYDQHLNCRSGHPGASGHRTDVRTRWGDRPCPRSRRRVTAWCSAPACAWW